MLGLTGPLVPLVLLARKVYRVFRDLLDLMVNQACPDLRAPLGPQVFKALVEILEDQEHLDLWDQLALQDLPEVPD